MDEITQKELDELILNLEDRLHYLSTQMGVSNMVNGKTARELCLAYRAVISDLKAIIL